MRGHTIDPQKEKRKKKGRKSPPSPLFPKKACSSISLLFSLSLSLSAPPKDDFGGGKKEKKKREKESRDLRRCIISPTFSPSWLLLLLQMCKELENSKQKEERKREKTQRRISSPYTCESLCLSHSLTHIPLSPSPCLRALDPLYACSARRRRFSSFWAALACF